MINLYLDLDETLIFSIDKDYKNKNYKNKRIDLDQFDTHDFDHYTVIQRPGLQRFLDWLFKNFNVSIWSAGQRDYVHNIAKEVISKPDRTIKRILTYDDCKKSMKKYGEESLKDTRFLHQFKDHHQDNVLLIDDLDTNTFKYSPNKKNSIRVKQFLGDIDDNYLFKLKKDLELVLLYYKAEKNLDSIELLRKNLY